MRTSKEYLDSIHRFGRVSALVSLGMMVALPFILGLWFNAMPDFMTVLKASVGLLALFLPITISEVLAYTPIIGSAIYLSLITGNILNMKLPAAANAMKIMNVEQGSEKGDVLSSIAIGASSITTVAVMILGALLMVPLKPVLLLPEVKTATSYILPALFGGFGVAMIGNSIGGGIVAKGRLLAGIVPTILIACIYFFAKPIMNFQGLLIIVFLPITYYGSKFLFRKGIIQVRLPGEK